MLRASPDPKDWRPPVALRHGFALQKWSASRQNFLEGGPRTFPGIESLKRLEPFRKFLVPTTFAVRTENCDPEIHVFHLNQGRRLEFGVHMAVTGIGISDDHL